jgi:hypothetical protein
MQGVVQDVRTGNMPESRTVMARLAYLIDLQTIRIMDLLTNATLATINHDTRIDWLVRLTIIFSRNTATGALRSSVL